MYTIPLWLLLLVIGAGAVLGAVLMRRHQRLPGPVCGRCGYLVKGLPGWVCPECGSDLREVGIRTPGMYGPVPALWKAVIWTLVILLLGASAVTVVPQYLPFMWREQRTSELSKPPSGAYKRIEVQANGWGYKQPTSPRIVNFRLIPHVSGVAPQSQVTLLVTLPDLTCRYAGGAQTHLGELTTQRILDWMAVSGVNTQDPKVQKEADELFRLAGQLRKGRNLGEIRLPSFSFGAGMSASGGPAEWAVPSLIAVWLIIWVVGLWYIRRTRQPEVAQVTSSS